MPGELESGRKRTRKMDDQELGRGGRKEDEKGEVEERG